MHLEDKGNEAHSTNPELLEGAYASSGRVNCRRLDNAPLRCTNEVTPGRNILVR